MKERKYIQNKTNKEFYRRKKNTSEHQACKEFSILFNMARMDIRYREGEEMEEHIKLFSFSIMLMGGR